MNPDSRMVPASSEYSVVRKRNPLEEGLPRMKWRERWKTDFLLSRPPYQAKTTAQALSAFFSPFRSPADFVNPQYIQDGNRLFARSLENLVLAVRGLSSKSYKIAHQNLRRVPVYTAILEVFRGWDIDAMNRELAVLQREPRNRSFADFIKLTLVVLRPYYRLVRLNPHVHLLPAITKMYELVKVNVVNREERDALQRYHTIAQEELPLIFPQVLQHFYPVLLKVLSGKLVESDHFFHENEEDILAFLNLKEEDLVRDMPETAEEPVGVIVVVSEPQKPTTPRLAQAGLALLDNLFPRAGWGSLESTPDLFSYFQTVFEYPKGSDLIPVDDAIQVILPLSEVLQQLFYGFQNIQWGTTLNHAGEVIPLQEELDKGIARWHFFIEEFFGKNYLPLLQEYCREVERAGHLSNDAKRREHQLLWLKRNYLLPHLQLPVMDGMRAKSLGYPNLAIQVREILELLAPVAVDVDEKGTRSLILLNPEARVRFPVSSMVSLRFQSALRRTGIGDQGERKLLDQGNNKSLLFYTVAQLSTLDHLLSAPTSLLYSRPSKYLYRTSGLSGDDKPVYNAPKKNSLALLKKLNEQLPPDLDGHPWQTTVGELYGSLVVVEEIKARIHEHLSQKRPFALVAFRVWPPEAGEEFPDFIQSLLVQETELHTQDDGTWWYVMRDTREEEAEDFARKILGSCAQRDPPLAVGALIIPFVTNGTLDRLLTLPTKGWEAAVGSQPQILGIWVNLAQIFEFRTDLPKVALAPPDELPFPTTDDLPEA